MRIAVGNDHAGYDAPEPFYKPEIVAYLEGKGVEVLNCGCDSADAVDYPDVANAVAEAVASGEADTGLLLCGTGIGMSITANRHAGIRAALCTSPEMARLSREHNDSNVLCLGRRVLTLEACFAIIDAWLKEDFSRAERHRRRVEKMG
jgi:ribose 5-phosphate isomerase B